MAAVAAARSPAIGQTDSNFECAIPISTNPFDVPIERTFQIWKRSSMAAAILLACEYQPPLASVGGTWSNTRAFQCSAFSTLRP